jgi:hypothetical protein
VSDHADDEARFAEEARDQERRELWLLARQFLIVVAVVGLLLLRAALV